MSDIAEIRAELEEALRMSPPYETTSKEHVRKALAALGRIEAGGAEGWQDISTAPKDATHVLLWWPHWYHVPVTGYFDLAHGWQSEYAIADDGVEPLNWQPLPPPPASQPEKEGKS